LESEKCGVRREADPALPPPKDRKRI